MGRYRPCDCCFNASALMRLVLCDMMAGARRIITQAGSLNTTNKGASVMSQSNSTTADEFELTQPFSREKERKAKRAVYVKA